MDYVAFTDQETQSNGWEVRPLARTCASPRLTARWHKLHVQELFPNATISIWLDDTHRPKGCSRDLVQWLQDAEIAACPHYSSTSTLDEAFEIIRLQKDEPGRVWRQYRRQMAAGFPDNVGVWETGVLVRKHTPQLQRLNECWWGCVVYGSWRDQLSFPYALWETGLHCSAVPEYASRTTRWWDFVGRKEFSA